MAKSTVDSIVAKVKRRIDYAITDTDLDTLIIDAINDALKVVYQELFNAGLFKDIGNSDGTNIKTTANQAYIDISSTLASADEIIRLSERTNDKTIDLITYQNFIGIYTDPTANTSSTPDAAAIWTNRLYLGPTPSAADLVIYVEYVAIPTDVVSGGTLPYQTKYDPLVIAIACRELKEWMDAKDATGITVAEQKVEKLKKELIINSVHNFGMINQSASREPVVPYFSPRRVIN